MTTATKNISKGEVGEVKIENITETSITITLIRPQNIHLGKNLSKSKKSYILATTNGFWNLPNGEKIGINWIKMV